MLKVVCAVLLEEGKVLAAQRSGKMRHPYQWEFPGGKCQAAESPEQALCREIWEELGLKIKITNALPPVQHTYAEGEILLMPYICHRLGGHLQLLEHADARWFTPQQLPQLNWVAADVPIVQHLLSLF